MDVMVLCYHAVSPTWKASLSVTQEALERQLTWLTRHGWRGSTFTEAVLAPVAERTLAVTFDDAYRSVLTLAYPVLSALGLPGTVFVPTSFADSEKPLSWPGIAQWADTVDAPELRGLSWSELGELAEDGWEVGSHTCTHPHLTQLSDDHLSRELEVSRATLGERMGAECLSIAYPYGDVDHRVAEAAHAAGYRTGAGMSSHLAKLGELRWPRVGIYHVDRFPRFRLKTNLGMRGLRASRLWPQDALP